MTESGAPISRRRFAAMALAAVPALAACGAGTREAPAVATATGPRKVAYGSDPSQFGEFTEPAGSGVARGLVVVVHGGYWRSDIGLDLMRPAAADLAKAGWATWNIEYRRVGAGAGGGGGWTATFDDVAQALDHVTQFASARVDAARVYALGHSAGGHLAAWLATRPGLPAGAPGAGPKVKPAGVVSQAGVLDLIAGVRLGDGAIVDLVGGTPASAPDRYAIASPAERLPLRVPIACVHGTADTVVPVSQSENFVRKATAVKDRAQFLPVQGVDHIGLIRPGTPGWKASVDALNRVSAR